jgi:hypothetical protein
LACPLHQSFDLRRSRLRVGDRIEYAYDFGDNWQHVLELEDKTPPAPQAVYPLCVGGECSEDYHLHEFTAGGRAVGDPEVDEEGRVIDERTVRLPVAKLRPPKKMSWNKKSQFF